MARPLLAWLLALAAGLAVAPGCSGCSDSAPAGAASGAGGTPVPGDLGVATIGPEGGTLAASDGSIALIVPPGALLVPVAFTLRVAPLAPAGHLGQVYEIGPPTVVFGTEATVITRDDPSAIGSAEESSLRLAIATVTTWTPLSEPIVDAAAHTIAGKTIGLGVFGVIVDDGGGGSGGAGGASGGGGAGGTGGTGGAGGVGGAGGSGGAGGGCALPCVADAPSTATCVEGRCVVTIVETAGAASFRDVVVAGGDVYWLDTSAGCDLYEAPAAGGASTLIAALDGVDGCGCSPMGAFLAADATSLYWAENGVCSIPLGGGPLTILVPGDQLGVIQGLAPAGADVAWVDDAAGVARVSTLGGAPQPISPVTATPAYLFADAVDAYWLEAAGDPRTTSPATAYAAPLAGGGATPIGSALPAIASAAIGGGAIFGVTDAGGIVSIPTSGGAPQLLYATTTPATTSLSAVTTDGAFVYWAEDTTTSLSILRMTAQGTDVTTLLTTPVADDLASIGQLALDADSVYWTQLDQASRSRVLKITPR